MFCEIKQNSQKIPVPESHLSIVAGLQPATLLRRRPQHRCFPVTRLSLVVLESFSWSFNHMTFKSKPVKESCFKTWYVHNLVQQPHKICSLLEIFVVYSLTNICTESNMFWNIKYFQEFCNFCLVKLLICIQLDTFLLILITFNTFSNFFRTTSGASETTCTKACKLSLTSYV